MVAPFWMVYPEHFVEHTRPWEKAVSVVLKRNPPRTRAYGFLPAGVYALPDYLRQLLQKPNTFFYGVLWNKLYRRDVLEAHGLRIPQVLFAEDQLFNLEYLHFVRTVVSIPDIGYHYLQNPQSVSHTRVSTADILAVRRRAMQLYRTLCAEAGLSAELRGAVLRSPFGENEFTLPPLDTPQAHFCKL